MQTEIIVAIIGAVAVVTAAIIGVIATKQKKSSNESGKETVTVNIFVAIKDNKIVLISAIVAIIGGGGILGMYKLWDEKNPHDGTIISIQATDAKTNVQNVTLVLNANGGTFSSGATTQKQTFPANIVKPLDGGTPTRTDYTFVCWNTKQNGSGTNYYNDTNAKFGNNETLYAVWKQIPPPEPTGPKYLSNLTISAKHGHIVKKIELEKDIYDNVYRIGYKLGYHPWSGDTYIEFVLNKKFDYFSFKIAVPSDVNGEKNIFLEIMGDSKMLYKSPALNKKTKAFEEKLDVRGQNFLTIKIAKAEDYGLAVLLVDGKVW